MFNTAEFLHYGVVSSIIALNSISVGLGQGLTSHSALSAINRQPSARGDILKVAMLGMGLIETVAVLALIVAIIMLINIQTEDITSFSTIAECGIALAIGVTGFVIGLASAIPAQAACHAVARQPFFTQHILSFMLMTQVLIQTPMITGMLVSLFIQGQSMGIETYYDSLRLLAAGLCVGIGSIGPAIGLSHFSKKAIEGVGINTHAYNKLLSFTFISEAIIETPIIFCLVISIILLFVIPHAQTENILDGIIFLAAGLCTGLGTVGPGISSGRTGAAACTQIAHNPDNYNLLSRTSMLAQGLIETAVIYAVLLSLIMLLFR